MGKKVNEQPSQSAEVVLKVKVLKPFNTSVHGNFKEGEVVELPFEISDQLEKAGLVKVL